MILGTPLDETLCLVWWGFFCFWRIFFPNPLLCAKFCYMKRLAWLSVEDYAATQMELVVVSAMKGYLRRMPEKEAFKKVEAILDPKVIRLAGDDGAPMPIQSFIINSHVWSSLCLPA